MAPTDVRALLPDASLARGAPLSQADVLLGGVEGLRDGGLLHARFTRIAALRTTGELRTESVLIADVGSSCVRLLEWGVRGGCGRAASHAARPWRSLEAPKRYYAVRYPEVRTLACYAQPSAPVGVGYFDGVAFVADAAAHVVRQLSLPPPPADTGPCAHDDAPSYRPNGTVLAGALGERGYADSRTSLAGVRLDSPSDVVSEPSGGLFIADAGNDCVRYIRLVNDSVRWAAPRNDTWASRGALDPQPSPSPGRLQPSPSPGPSTARARIRNGLADSVAGVCASAISELKSPGALAYDETDDALYIADTGHNCIRVVRPHEGSGRRAVPWFGNCNGPSPLSAPRGLAIAAPSALDGLLGSRRADNSARSAWALYVADTGNRRVLRLRAGGREPTEIVAPMRGGRGGVGGGVWAAGLGAPVGVAIDDDEGLLIADGSTIRAARLVGMRAITPNGLRP